MSILTQRLKIETGSSKSEAAADPILSEFAATRPSPPSDSAEAVPAATAETTQGQADGTTTRKFDSESITAEITRRRAEADALRDAQKPLPEQRAAYKKVLSMVGAYLVGSPPDNPDLLQWVNYGTGIEQLLAEVDGECNKVAKKVQREQKQAQAAVDAETSQVAEEVTPDDWMNAVAVDRKMKPLSVPYNANLFLSCHPELKGKIRWDSFSKRVEILPGVIANAIKQKEPTLESIVVEIENWLYKEAGLLISYGDLKRQVVATALKNQYSSLADHLLSFQWDGTRRIDGFLIERCGARVVLKNGKDITEHIMRISRRFFIAAVARGLEPGCQVDTVLVLEGPAGLRKSSVWRIIGGPFACETEHAIGGNKDSNQLASTRWIIDLAELDSFRNRDHTTINAFITKRSDYYRPPYAAQHEEFRRICVFVGTTNKEEWIEDSTGDRRFWPVFVTKLDLPAIEEERDQLIAEAVYYFQHGGVDKCPRCAAGYRAGGEKRCSDHRWWLDPAEQKVADGVTAERLTEVAYSERIKEWWGDLGKTALSARSVDPEGFIFSDVAEGALKLTPDKWEREKISIGKALKQLGFTKDKSKSYHPNDELRAWRDERRQPANNKGSNPDGDK